MKITMVTTKQIQDANKTSKNTKINKKIILCILIYDLIKKPNFIHVLIISF